MDAVDRIRAIMDEKKVKQKDIIEYLGVNQGTFAKWVSLKEDNRRDIPNTVLAKIAHFLEVDIEYLLGLQESKRNSVVQLDETYIELPTIYAGAGAEAFCVESAEQVYYPKKLLPPHIHLDANTLAIKIVGNSMEPLYYENDIVFVDMVNGREFLHVNGTYIVRYGDTLQIKDVEFVGNQEILLFSRNSPAVINPTQLGLEWEIVGKPFAMLRPSFGSKLNLK